MKLIPLARELETEFDAEISKPVERGERKKRLQTLTNALAAWWQVGLGRRLKIEVRYQRRKHGLTVLGWSGEFLNVARALFVQLDGFYDSEVVSACKNEVEDRAGQRIRKWPPPGFESFELRCIVPPDSTA